MGEGAAEVRLPCLLGCFFTSPDTSMDAASTTMPAPSAWPRRAAHVRERESARERERESERASEREGGREGGKGRSRGGGGRERDRKRKREREREKARTRQPRQQRNKTRSAGCANTILYVHVVLRSDYDAVHCIIRASGKLDTGPCRLRAFASFRKIAFATAESTG